MTTQSTKVPKQPLHPSVIPRLDPEYVAFHNEHILYITPPHTLPWDPALRDQPAVPGGSLPLPVGKFETYDLTHTKFLAFTPEGNAPTSGWPVLIFFHGGGWTFGNINSETSFATNMCVRAKCVVISVDYRLAPEHKYPTAVDDAVESLHWVIRNGQDKLGIDINKIAVGGSSSGGNLAAILALKAAQANLPVMFQLLIVPVTDNTASVETRWADNIHTPWLSPERMLWFRNNYLPNQADWTKWDASPIFAPDDLVKKLPRAWVAVAELDILRDEGIAYAEKLREQGVHVDVDLYEGGPHPIMAMDGAVLKLGKKLVSDAAAALGAAFNGLPY